MPVQDLWTVNPLLQFRAVWDEHGWKKELEISSRTKWHSQCLFCVSAQMVTPVSGQILWRKMRQWIEKNRWQERLRARWSRSVILKFFFLSHSTLKPHTHSFNSTRKIKIHLEEKTPYVLIESINCSSREWISLVGVLLYKNQMKILSACYGANSKWIISAARRIVPAGRWTHYPISIMENKFSAFLKYD